MGTTETNGVVFPEQKNRTNHMEYMEVMDVLEADFMDHVISAMEQYDYVK